MTVFKFNKTPAPSTLEPRKDKGPLDEDELQTIMDAVVADAEALVDDELSPERARATDFFNGEPFGNEEEGRSQFVVTSVRDVIRGMLPSFMRVLFGPERVVEFSSRLAFGAQPAQVALAVARAEQATDYVRYLIEQNDGFTQTHSVLMDGMVKKLGIYKWWWDKSTRRMARDEGVSEDDLNLLASREDVHLLKVVPEDVRDNEGYAMEPGEAAASPRYTVDYMVDVAGTICIRAIPPEEYLISRGAHNQDDALMVGHRTELTRGELIALGIPEDILDEHGHRDIRLEQNEERVERNVHFNETQSDDPDAGEANKKIKYVEAYPYLDLHGTGDLVLCKVCMIGPGNFVALPPEPVEDRPFALFCPIPEPHAAIGQSMADLTMDLQLVKSSIIRSMFDSLALSIYPRVAFVEGLVNVDDLLTNAIGSPIRMQKEGAAVPFTHPFTGEAALPIMDYLDQVEENRTGRDKGSMGLDADALQSSTREGVEKVLAASQEQIEYILRLFAEQTLKPLFRGVYKMLVKYKPAAQLVRLRGLYVPINTATWESDMDVIVNVGLGTTNIDKKLAALTAIAEKQENILANLGPVNPLTSFHQYSKTLLRLTELAGFKNATDFFSLVDPNWQPPQQQPQLTPEQTIAQAQIQIEQMKAQKDIAIKQAEMMLKQRQQAFDEQLEIRKLANEFTLRRYQIDAQFKSDFTQMNLEADARAEEAALSGTMDVIRHQHDTRMAEHERAMAQQQQEHEQSLAEAQQAHDQEMAERQTAAQEQAARQAGSETTE